MTQPSTQNLFDKLRAKTIEDRQAVERITNEQFELLKKNFLTQCAAANEIITGNMDDLRSRLRMYQLKFWLIPLSASLFVIPCLILSTLWVDRYLDRAIRQKSAELTQHTQTLDALTAVGITHQAQNGNLFLITPNDKKPQVYQHPNYPDQWIINIEE